MQEGAEGKKKKRRKKKSKFGYYLYAVVVLSLTVANLVLGTLLLTYVQEVRVTGNENVQKSAILSWIQEDPLTVNSLYTLLKFKTGSYTMPIYLDDVQVRLDAPWKLHVNVSEKQIIGCLLDEASYVYFDAEGLVLRKTSEYAEEIPMIEGLVVEETSKFKPLQVENEKVFSYIVSITEAIEEKALSPDRIVWEDDSMNLYFEQVCVKLGKTGFAEKIKEMTAVLDTLEGKNGTLHLEHYTSDSSKFSFDENVEKNY